MPKRLKKPSRQNGAKRDAPSGERSPAKAAPLHADAPAFKELLSAHMSKLGAMGGKISGAKRMENLSDKERREIALKAAQARWAKKR
jgi:hypothetical protein